MTTPPPPPGSGGNQPYDPTGSSPYPGSGGSTPSGQPTGPSSPSTPSSSTPSGSPSYPSSGQSSYPDAGQSSYPGGPAAGGPSSYPGPAPAPGQYGAPQGGSDSTKMLSLVSMGTGIAGIVICCCWGLPIFSIIALVTGYIAKNQTKANPRPDLKTFITVGLVTGAIGVLIAILYWILVATGVIDLNTSYSTTGF